MKHEVAGDPCTGLKWTRRTTHKIARELRAGGIAVSARTVARLLKKLRFSLRINRKMIGRGSRPDRDEQFTYIARLRTRFAQRHRPIVSIDSKKKEMVGNFKNGGTAWNRTAVLVDDHDFRSDATGMALPTASTTSRGTGGPSSSASPTTRPTSRWTTWSDGGPPRGEGGTPTPQKLLVLADGGGSNGPRNRAFKYGLQTRLCNVHHVAVTVCHYPAGASKWNPIEHRLFSEISKNWKGRPLDSYGTIFNYIRTTRTATGLRVKARLVMKRYTTGVSWLPPQMRTFQTRPQSPAPRNSTLHPTT